LEDQPRTFLEKPSLDEDNDHSFLMFMKNRSNTSEKQSQVHSATPNFLQSFSTIEEDEILFNSKRKTPTTDKVDGEAEDPVAKRTKYSQDFFWQWIT
jgi:hypothetical protein